MKRKQLGAHNWLPAFSLATLFVLFIILRPLANPDSYEDTELGLVKEQKLRVISLNVFYFPFSRDSGNISKTVMDYHNLDLEEPTQYLNKYFTPLVNVILNWKWLLPDWTVRIYISRGHPYIQNLRNLGAEVVEKDFDPARWSAATAWRFTAEDDEGVEYWASRESESPPTFQDAAILMHWTEHTNFTLHAAHMAGAHQTLNSGLFGGVRGYLSTVLNGSIAQALQRFQEKVDSTGRNFGSKYGDDQFFLAEIWPLTKMSEQGIAYETFNRTWCNFKICVPFPAYPGNPEEGFRASMNNIRPDEAILCHHPDKPYCRRHRIEGEHVWRRLYELCTEKDFFTGLPVQGQMLGFDQCPYKTVTAADTWKDSGH